MYKIIAIATTGDRPDQLEKTMTSLSSQADEIIIYNNSWSPDLGALAKFYFLEDDCYYFTCDDDIIYPPDYIKRTIEEIEKHKCIIAWHGRELSPDANKYYGYPHLTEVRFFQETKEPKRLDTGGTGCMGFRTDYFKPEIWNKPYKKCADLTCGLEAIKQGKKIISPEKKQNWITAQETKSSIFATESKGKQEVQIKLMNEILRCKNG